MKSALTERARKYIERLRIEEKIGKLEDILANQLEELPYDVALKLIKEVKGFINSRLQRYAKMDEMAYEKQLLERIEFALGVYKFGKFFKTVDVRSRIKKMAPTTAEVLKVMKHNKKKLDVVGIWTGWCGDFYWMRPVKGSYSVPELESLRLDEKDAEWKGMLAKKKRVWEKIIEDIKIEGFASIYGYYSESQNVWRSEYWDNRELLNDFARRSKLPVGKRDKKLIIIYHPNKIRETQRV